jgi:hypothetical protein
VKPLALFLVAALAGCSAGGLLVVDCWDPDAGAWEATCPADGGPGPEPPDAGHPQITAHPFTGPIPACSQDAGIPCYY